MVDSVPYRQRSDSRRMAFQLLFSSEMNDLPAATLFDEGYYCEEIGLPCDFSRTLFVGTCEHLEQIDQLIDMTSIDWQLNRMPLPDKAILRLAIYEMLYVDDVPIGVSIDEAVELAKDFGASDKSPAFVNGVLGKIALSLQPEEAGDAGEIEPSGEAELVDEAGMVGEARLADEAEVEPAAEVKPTRVTDNLQMEGLSQ